MPDIDLHVRDYYSGQNLNRAIGDMRALNTEIERSSGGSPVSGVASQVAAQVEAAGSVTEMVLRSQSAALTGLERGSLAASQSIVTVVNNVGGATRKTTAELESLRRQLEAIENMAANASPRAQQSILANGAGLRGRIGEIEAELAAEQAAASHLKRVRPGEEIEAAQTRAAMEDQKRDGSSLSFRMKAEEQDRKFWAAREKEIADEEERARRDGVKSLVERNKFIEQDRRFWESQTKEQSRRVRPGEELERAQSEAQREAQMRAARAQREQEAAIRRDEAQSRRLENEGRRDTRDHFYAGMVLSGIGAGMMAPIRASAGQYGDLQRTQIGLQATEGANAPAVLAQAQRDALNVYGASYRDLANFQSQLRLNGETTQQARSNVLALSDIIAGTGGNADKFGRVLNNLSQVDAQGHLTARDMRDFQVNLIPMTEFLAKVKDVDKSDIAGLITKKEISSADVQAAIQLMAQDPRFKGRSAMLENDTLPGQLEKVNEQLQHTGELAGQVIAPALEKVLNVANNFLGFINTHPGLAAAGTYAVGGVALAASGGGIVEMARAGLGTVGNVMPEWMKNSKLGEMVFGGNRGQTPMNPLYVKDVAGGFGGGAGSPASTVAREAAEAAGVTGGKAGAAWYAAQLGPQFSTGAGWANLGGATVGSSLYGAALGAGAGMGVSDDMRTLGYSNRLSDTSGIATALGTAALTAFNPAAAAIIAAGEGLRYGINAAYSDPVAERAEKGNGLDPAVIASTKGNDLTSLRARQDAWRTQQLKEKAAADASRSGLWGTGFDPFGVYAAAGEEHDQNAQNAMWQANALNKKIKNAPTIDRAQQYDADFKAHEQAYRGYSIGDEPVGAMGQDSGAISNRPRNIEMGVGNIAHHQGGGQTILLTATVHLPLHPDTRRVVQGMDHATRL